MTKRSEYDLAAEIIWKQKFGTRPIDINSDDWMDCSMDAVKMMRPEIEKEADTTGQDDTTDAAKGAQVQLVTWLVEEMTGMAVSDIKDEYEGGGYNAMSDAALAELNRLLGTSIQQI